MISLTYAGGMEELTPVLLAPSGADTGVPFLCKSEAAGAASCTAKVDGMMIAANSTGDYKLKLNNTGSQELTVTTIITATPAVGGDTYDIAIATTEGSTVSYPQEARVTATVTRSARIAGLVAFAEVTDPLGVATRIDLVDDGTNGDSFAEDGTYSALIDYTVSGFYDVKVTVDNSAGTGTETTAGELMSPTADGSPLPPPGPTDPVTENFSRSATTQFNVVGVQADDHADNPAGGACTVVADDNADTRGRIDFAGDVDCFFVVPSNPASKLVFRANGFSRGMNAVLTILDSAGVQIAMLDMSNTENPVGGVIATIVAPDAMGMNFDVRHADPAITSGGYDVSVGAEIFSDNDGTPSPPATTSCTDQFGTAPEFILCEEAETTCSFNVLANLNTCEQICGGLGSACVGAVDNEGLSCTAIPGSNDTCQTARETEICICERTAETPLPPAPPSPPPPSPPVPPAPSISCTEQFGSAQGFLLCAETPTTCSFNATTNGGTCEQMCGSLGSTCVDAVDNEGSSCTAVPGSSDTCQTPRLTEMCTCAR